ncbi:MAG: DoxX family protein [Winogradskyella sp.]|nr:DoxX family protein [Winogradskyella sp.]RZN78351.1 MAG: DoxX family protein [Winogradskyella sp.]
MLKTNYNDLGLLILRLGFGGLMLINHGIPKLDKLNGPIEFADPIGVGATASLILCLIGEVLAPVLIIFGIKTKFAAVPAAITMGVAAFIVHGSDPLARKEMALLYFIAFVVIFLAGPGKFSIDGRKGR